MCFLIQAKNLLKTDNELKSSLKDLKSDYGSFSDSGSGSSCSHSGSDSDSNDGKQCFSDRECDDYNPCTKDECIYNKCVHTLIHPRCDPNKFFVKPILECVEPHPRIPNKFIAHWGYRNAFVALIQIMTGPNNRFIPPPQDRGQTTDFLPGRHVDVFQTVFDGNDLTWRIHSPDGSIISDTANSRSERCEECRVDSDCNDQDKCTIDKCLYDKTCSNTPKPCPIPDECTECRCDPRTGDIILHPIPDCDLPCDSDTDCDSEELCEICICDHRTYKCICHPKNCFDGDKCTNDRCDERTGECIHEDKECPPPDTLCFVRECDSETGRCVQTHIDCSDDDECTVDTCIIERYRAKCIHTEIPDCREPPVNCTHIVHITVEDCSILNITEFKHDHEHIWEICHTSTFLGNQSAVVIGFDEYKDCKLNERGTCDNRHSVPDPTMRLCATDAISDNCALFPATHAIAMPDFTTELDWKDPPGILVEDEQSGTAHLSGVVQDGNIQLQVNVWFSGFVPSTDPFPSGSPKLELKENCYVNGSGTVNPDDWVFYLNTHGTLKGVPGTDFAGLHITITGVQAAQFGVGANGKNVLLGASVWFTWVVDHQPFNPQFHVPDSYRQGDININLNDTCNLPPLNYCDLFGEPQEMPANNWEVELAEGKKTITYCRNFTLHELLGCRAFDEPHRQLFNHTQDPRTHVITHNGTIHVTTLCPKDCEHHPSVCGEQIKLNAHTDLIITIFANGTSSATFTTKQFGLSVKWIRNIWLTGRDRGDLKVILETKIAHVNPTREFPFTTRLIDPIVLTELETGFPIEFVGPVPPCDNISCPGFCLQQWCLRTFGAGREDPPILDFSGFKPLRFGVEVRGRRRNDAGVNLDLWVKHTGDQAHLDGKLKAELQLFKDRDFRFPIDHFKKLVDCDQICGLLQLIFHTHLNLEIDKVYLCFSQQGDLVPFDPKFPETTGCNTANLDVVHELMFSRDPADQGDIDQATHQFRIVRNPPSAPHQEGFCFITHAFTKHKQLVQVRWFAEEHGGYGGLIEHITEYSFDYDDDSSQIEKRDYDTHSYSYSDYEVSCPKGYTYNYNNRYCQNPFFDHHNTKHTAALIILIVIVSLFVIWLICYFWGCGCCGYGYGYSDYCDDDDHHTEQCCKYYQDGYCQYHSPQSPHHKKKYYTQQAIKGDRRHIKQRRIIKVI